MGFKSLFLHIMEVRENMQDVKETIYGNRMNLSANCIGGVKFDMDDSLTVYMLERLDTVEEAVKRVEKVFRTDPLIAKRSRGVGVLSREERGRSAWSAPWRAARASTSTCARTRPISSIPISTLTSSKNRTATSGHARWCACARCSSPSACSASASTSSPTARWPCTWSASRKANPSPAREAPRGELIYYLQTNGTDTPGPPQVARAVLHELGGPHRHDEGLPARRHPVFVNSLDPCVSCTER